MDDEHSCLYINGVEPNDRTAHSLLINKTISALKYVNNNFNYKYIIRTSIGTFWNLFKLQPYLKNMNSNIKVIGQTHDNGVISGTCMIFTHEVATKIVLNQNCIKQNIYEDLAFGYAFKSLGYNIFNLNRRFDFIHNTINDVLKQISITNHIYIIRRFIFSFYPIKKEIYSSFH